ncbi:sesquiterpene synthase [Arachis ipaensis]|uniref:sesquiterpene synthase n=1 Tax=Arachis ipaensis TaxID=130454 RepID=UPI000A2B309C|nr:sesquiterpene synthase [Arachis ipaensis]
MSLAPSSELKRPCANFAPNIWQDIFIQYADSQSLEVNETMKQEVQIHKEKVKLYLSSNDNNILQKLSLIDSIQRLSISYHFEREVDKALEEIYNNFTNNSLLIEDYDLHFIALLFRLFRQNGYHISSDVFIKFKNIKGDFNEINVVQNVEEIWSLYEAAQLRIHGEDILEEAHKFTYNKLKSFINQLSPCLGDQINRSLRLPLHKTVSRIRARSYMSFYKENPSHNKVLLSLAKLDFNMLQSLHKKEIGNITRWCKKLGFATKVSYARDRVVETFFWPLTMSSEPKYSTWRLILGKLLACICLLDDTYDAFGTFEELQLLTEAIKRLIIGVQTSVYPLMLATFIVMEDFATKEMLDWNFIGFPKIINAVSLMVRLANDLASHKFEQERKHVASAVECCMKQYGISQEEAYNRINKEISDCWKDINEECLNSHDIIPKPLINCILNLARSTEVIYENFEDKYTNNELLKDHIAALLLDPIII